MKIKGTGSIKQVMSKGKPVKNSWQLVLSLGVDPLTGRRTQKYRHFSGTKTAAKDALAEFKREIENGLRLDADTVTFGAFSKQWQETRKTSGRLAATTLERDRFILEHLNRHLSSIKLQDINTSTVRALYLALANENVGVTSIEKSAQILRQLLRQAVDDDLILKNVAERVEFPKSAKQKSGTALDRNGVVRLAEALTDYESKIYPFAEIGQQRLTGDMSHVTAARLALAGALRRGEVLALSWGDIDLDNGSLHVHSTLCTVTGMLKPPKTENGNRTVFIDSQMLASLKKWKNRQAQYLLTLGIQQNEQTPVISTETGGRMDGHNFDRWWRAFRKQYKFDNLRFHDLRHTSATMLVSSGLNIKAVSSRLGHSSVGITLDLYSHALKDDDMKAADVMGEIMGRAANL